MPANYFNHHFLIATPQLHNSYFERAVILLIEHSTDGAFGLVINKCSSTSPSEAFEQLALKAPKKNRLNLLLGGPLNPENGMVLHRPSADEWQDSSTINGNLRMTTSKDILIAMSNELGPKHAKLVLGYSGWSAGQLDAELLENSWLTVPVDSIDIFGIEPDGLLDHIAASIGLNYTRLVGTVGHA